MDDIITFLDHTKKVFKNIISNLIRQEMKIGIICHPTMGGSGIVGSKVGVELAKKNHKIHFIMYQKPFIEDLKESENVKIHQIPLKSYHALKFVPITINAASKIVEIVKKYELDLINVHYALPYSTSAYLAKQICNTEGRDLPVITTVHGTDVHTVGLKKHFKSIIKFTLENSDGITAVSQFLANIVKEKYEISKDVEVIYNFVDSEKFRRVPNPELRAKYAKPHEKIIFHASNFRRIKNIDDIVRAFSIISKEVPSKLLLAGDGPERLRIERLAKKLGVEDKTYFLGSCKNLEQYYSIADLFMLVSQLEGFGLALAEAMSCEVPVIATNVGSIPEIVEHGKNGYLTWVGEYKEMARYAIEILSDEKKQKKMGKDGRKTVIEKFSPEKIISQYEAYYRHFL